MEHRPDIAAIEAVPGVGSSKEAHNVAMRDDYALRFAGRARSVDNVSCIVGVSESDGIKRRIGRNLGPFGI